MLNFGKGFEEIEVGKDGKPEAKGYEMIVVNAEQSVSKNSGNTMLVISFDIADGPHKGYFGQYPLKMYLPFMDADGELIDKGLKRLKKNIITIIDNNKAVFPEEQINWEAFEEKRLIGTRIGGVLKYDDNGYLDIRYITTVEKALKAETAKKPEPKPILDASSPNGLF